MRNPIIQMLNGNRQNPMNNIVELVSSLRNGNPDAIYRQMMNTNPQFKKFIQDNQGKSPEQIAYENGIDMNSIQQFLR